MVLRARNSLFQKSSLLLYWLTAVWTAAGACVLLAYGESFEGYVGLASLVIFIFFQSILPRITKMSNPAGIRVIISLLMLISLTIGRYFSLYKRIEHFDKLQHLFYGIVICILSSIAIYKTIPDYSRREPEIHPILFGLTGTGSAMIVLFIWELFEYTCDRLFDANMQDWKAGGISGLADTMIDMAVGMAGAVITSAVIMRLYSRNKQKFYDRFIAGFFPAESPEINKSQIVIPKVAEE